MRYIGHLRLDGRIAEPLLDVSNTVSPTVAENALVSELLVLAHSSAAGELAGEVKLDRILDSQANHAAIQSWVVRHNVGKLVLLPRKES